jgi:cell wall-associated NlpC family hydrolase
VKGAGVGCGTLLTEVYGAMGFDVPTVAEMGHFPHDWHYHTREERYLAIVQKFTRVIPGPPQPGDIVLFKFGPVHSHSAIVVDWPRVIHVMWNRAVEYGEYGKAPLKRGRGFTVLTVF